MTKWKIVADSGSNILEFSAPNDTFSYASVPLMLNIGTDVYIDNKNLDLNKLLDAMEKERTASSSACPAPDSYMQAFKGADNVLCLTLSSGLSGSYNSAMIAANMLKETEPGINVHIFDSLSAGAEMDLLVHKAIELAQTGVNMEQMIEQLNAYHQHTDIAFMLESVDNLVKNGRLNKLVGSMIGLLGIRLIGVRTPDGKIELATKAKGTKRAMKSLLEEMRQRGYQGGKVIISYCLNPESADTFRQLILNEYPQASVSTLEMDGLCTYYAQRNGLLIGYEKN